MKCKYCNEELMDDVVICPACGGDNTKKPASKLPMIIAIICCLAVVIGVIATVISMNVFPEHQTELVTLKSCYTVADEEVKSQKDVVVAKAGEFELTNGELQVIYWSMVYDFVDYLGDYATYYIDFTQPLSAQYYNQSGGITWEHYFLDMALNTWRRYEVLTKAAEEAGVKLSDTLQARLDGMYESMEAVLKDAGFETVEDMVRHDFGNAATFEDYMEYMDIYYHGNNYYNLMYMDLEATDAEIEAYYTQYESDFISSGYGKEVGLVVEARHILIEPADENVEADWVTAKNTAQDLLDQWIDGGAKEEDFADLAYQYSACGSYVNGGLLDPFGKGDMVQEFEDWCFTEGRQYGDYGMVKTQYGWHIMFFVSSYEPWYEVALSNVLSDKLYAMMTELENECSMVVAYSRIVLGDVKLA